MRDTILRTKAIPALLVLLLVIGCTQSPTPTGGEARSPNAVLLDEINQAGTWFHARKVRPLWAKQLDQDQTVQTIEGTEEVKAGSFLCRGEAGDLWPQTAQSLQQKYESTEEVDGEGWRKYVPRPDNQGVMAATVPHAFTVHTSWGVLSGKPGDFLVKNFSDREVDHPEDVWIVDQKLFEATYQAVVPER